MPEYRLYILDAATHIFDYRIAECDGDSGAVKLATLVPIAKHQWIEVWCRGRLVAEWRPSQDPWHTGAARDAALTSGGPR